MGQDGSGGALRLFPQTTPFSFPPRRGPRFRPPAVLALLLVLGLALGLGGPDRAGAGDDFGVRLEAFLEGVVRAQMEAFHSPGAAVVVVREGRVVLSRGWGLADPAKGRPFDPEKSVCQAGSISKTVTDVALLQLHDRGLLDLKADIRNYLGGFKLKTEYPQPISAANLMTHTAGFELRVDGVLARAPEEALPLERWVAENRRAQVRPPGVLTAYNNFDHTLAGLLVEKITGQPFADYAEENILTPLGMKSSSYRQPVPQDLAERMVRGHVYKKGRLRPVPQGVVQITPSAGLTASPLDLAGFMIALLQEGRLGQKRVLREPTARMMLESQYDLEGRPGGLTYGFNEVFFGEKRIVYHGGLISGVYNIMLFIPEEEVGLLLVYNSESAFWGIFDFIPLFLEYFYPEQVGTTRPEPLTPAEFHRFQGYYLPSSLKGSSFEPLLIPMGAARLSPTGQGTMLARWDWQTRPMEVVRTGEAVFQQTDGLRKIEFLKDRADRPQGFYFFARPTVTFERMSWYETPPFMLLMVGFNGIVFLAVPLVWFLSLRPAKARTAGRTLSRAGLAAVLGSVAYLVMAVGIIDALRDVYELAYGYGPLLRLGLKMPYLGAASALACLVLMVKAWRERSGRPLPRLFFSLAAFCLVLFSLWLAYWRMF